MVNVVGRLSINKVGVAFLKVTFPSISTFKFGIFFITSTAVWPLLTIFLSTLNILRSIPISNCGRAELVTVTLFKSVGSSSNLILPKSLSTIAIICCMLCPPPILMLKLKVFSIFLYPIAVMTNFKLPITGKFSKLKSPLEALNWVPKIVSLVFLVIGSYLLPLIWRVAPSIPFLFASTILP